VDCRADFLHERAAFKIELPHFNGGGADQTVVLKDNTALSWGKQ
jgi:hypothetical protein